MNDVATKASSAPRLVGTEHWTTKEGNVKLFLWNKCDGDPTKTKGTVLFVHGSSMASQPTFDLDVPGRPDSSAMEHFAFYGYDTWCVDMEGYGRSEKSRDNNAPISFGADDCFAAATYIQKLRGKRPFHVYGISSGALRAALFAQRHPEMVARLALDAMVWTGEGAPTLHERRKRLPEFQSKNRRPIDRAFVHSIFNRDHPGTADEKVIEAFADQILKLDEFSADRYLRGHVLEAAGGRSGEDHGADADHARPVGRHRELRGPRGVLRQAAQPRQAVLRDGRHLARELPAEELHDGLSHPARLLRAARADLQRMTLPLPRLRGRDTREARGRGQVGKRNA